jgi:hypothetical protein
MRKLRIVTNHKIRKLSWQLRPVLVQIDADDVMDFVTVACGMALFIELFAVLLRLLK